MISKSTASTAPVKGLLTRNTFLAVVSLALMVAAKKDPLEGLGDLGGLGGDGGGMPDLGGLGGAGGLGGLEDMFKLEMNCPVRKCPKGEKLVQKPMEQEEDGTVTNGFSAVGCSDGGMAAMLSPGKKPAGKSKAETCCQKREVCLQTCGFTKKKCENDFNACVNVRCSPADSSCSMDSKMNYIMEEMMGGMSKTKEGEANPKCAGYAKAQEEMCHCVEKEDFDEEFEKYLQSFYKIYNPAKADNIDMDAIYSKFKKGKEADIVFAMTMKYKKEGTIAKKEKGSDPLKDMMGGLGGGLGGLGGEDGMPDLGGLGGGDDEDLSDGEEDKEEEM